VDSLSDTAVASIITGVAVLIAAALSFAGVAYGKRSERKAESERAQREAASELERWQREREARHEQWLRERRGDAYASFLAASEELYLKQKAPHRPEQPLEIVRERGAALRAFTAADAQLQSFGSREAALEASRVGQLVTQEPETFPNAAEWTSALLRLTAQCRSDLGVKD
jgi:hypothetical protein